MEVGLPIMVRKCGVLYMEQDKKKLFSSIVNLAISLCRKSVVGLRKGMLMHRDISK